MDEKGISEFEDQSGIIQDIRQPGKLTKDIIVRANAKAYPWAITGDCPYVYLPS